MKGCSSRTKVVPILKRFLQDKTNLLDCIIVSDCRIGSHFCLKFVSFGLPFKRIIVFCAIQIFFSISVYHGPHGATAISWNKKIFVKCSYAPFWQFLPKVLRGNRHFCFRRQLKLTFQKTSGYQLCKVCQYNYFLPAGSQSWLNWSYSNSHWKFPSRVSLEKKIFLFFR